MNILKELIRFILLNSKDRDKLTKTKVTKLIYLIDLESSVKSNKQITNIKWYFDHYGPYVHDVYLTAKDDGLVEIIQTQNVYGNPKELLRITNEDYKVKLSNSQIAIANKVLQETDSLNWNEFIQYVYKTEPIKNGEKYSILNLCKD